MNCKNCGCPLPKDIKFCGKCGRPVEEKKEEVKVEPPKVNPNDLVVRPMVEPTNELAKLAKPEDKKNIIVRRTSPILIIFVFLLALALGFFGSKYFNKEEKTFITSFNGYSFEIPEGLKVNYQKDYLYLSNDQLKVSINIVDGSYRNVKPTSFDNYLYSSEKTFNNTKYHLFTQGEEKIVIMALGDDKLILMDILSKGEEKDKDIDKALKIALSAKKIEEIKTEDNNKLILDMKSVINREEANTGDIEDITYEDTYVIITLDEINE